MTRIFIDPHMFGEDWFGPCSSEILMSGKARLAYCEGTKVKKEIETVVKALTFYKLAGDMGLRDDANPDAVAKAIGVLEAIPGFAKEAACDDAHIFALNYEKPCKYIISKDKRMAKCRGELNKVADKRFCQFSIIGRDESYQKHKAKIVG